MTSDSLRRRRRKQTSSEIQQAAMALVRERGFDKVTVEDISVAAGISPRTFFNYFPNKESAIVWAPLDTTGEQAELFVTAGPAPHRQILDDLISLAIGEMAQSPPSRELLADLFEIAQTSVAVTTAILAQFDRYQQRLAALVAERIGADPNNEVPVLISMLAMTVTRLGIDRWAGADRGDGSDTPVQHMRDAAALLQSFVTQP